MTHDTNTTEPFTMYEGCAHDMIAAIRDEAATHKPFAAIASDLVAKIRANKSRAAKHGFAILQCTEDELDLLANAGYYL